MHLRLRGTLSPTTQITRVAFVSVSPQPRYSLFAYNWDSPHNLQTFQSFSRFKMELLGRVAAWVLSLPTPSDYQAFPYNPLYENVVKCLGAKLSSAATIYAPGSAQFANATNRWTEWEAPNVTLVVQVGSEADIVSTVSRAALGAPLPGLFC